MPGNELIIIEITDINTTETELSGLHTVLNKKPGLTRNNEKNTQKKQM